MKKGLLITLPRHDLVTEYLSYYSKEIIEEAEKMGLPSKQLKDKDANKSNFEKFSESDGYKLIVFNGHGTAKSIQGYKNEPLVEEGVNEEILKDKISYARACDAASSLGIKAAANSKRVVL